MTALNKDMDTTKSSSELEQEILILQDKIRQEKRKKAEDLFAHRLVYSAIILLIVFTVMCLSMEGASNWVQWPCLIVFFGVVFCIIGSISVHYTREKKEADQ